MLFRQLIDFETFTLTYLLADETSREAVLIDPVLERKDRDMRLLEELGLTLKYTLETHVHADHVTASGELRSALNSRTVVSGKAGAACADVLVKEGDVVEFGAQKLRVLETPGHTDGCVSYVHDDGGMVFTGDALLIRGTGRTDFQHGSSSKLYASIQKLFALPGQTRVFPAHDYNGFTESSIAEERAHNPRIAHKTAEQFADIMARLNLSKPKQIDRAVPANMACGNARGSQWAPLETAGAVPEVGVDWTSKHLSEIRLIDVRQPEEFIGELGHIKGSQLVPMSELPNAAEDWDRSLPVVVVCRSGRRSGVAAELLRARDFQHVASLRGGMQSWNEAGLRVER